MTINLVIERLVLEGLPLTARERDRLAEGLEAELARLFARDDVPATLVAGAMVPTLTTDVMRAGAPVEPSALGRRIARAVHGAFEP